MLEFEVVHFEVAPEASVVEREARRRRIRRHSPTHFRCFRALASAIAIAFAASFFSFASSRPLFPFIG